MRLPTLAPGLRADPACRRPDIMRAARPGPPGLLPRPGLGPLPEPHRRDRHAGGRPGLRLAPHEPHRSGPGEIGGRVENSRRQAYYAMPLGKPLTFDDELSASGKLALRHIGLRGVGYVGFFNSRRHTWRVWSSMAFRVWEEDDLGQVMFDWMSSDWQARGAETAILLPPDGEGPHLELPLRARGEGRPRLARRGPGAAHHRSHGQRPALRAPGRGAPVRAAEEGGARPDARGAAPRGC